MSATSLTPATAGTGSADLPATARSPVILVDWRAARTASRACCCPARPAVVAIMPPGPGRATPVELLLCGHHYRMHREALFAAGATFLDIDGARLSPGVWPED